MNESQSKSANQLKWIEHTYLVCPQCKLKKRILVKDLKEGQIYTCDECGFSGPFTSEQ